MNFLQPLTTLTFAFPLGFIFPVVLAFFWLIQKSSATGVGTGSSIMFADIPKTIRQRLRSPVLNVLMALFLIALSIAAARPQSVVVQNESMHARNLVLALDVSRSMGTADFDSALGQLSRMNAVQQVVREFISSRPFDRIGLVVFGSKAYVRAPLTSDHLLLTQLVEDLEIGMAGDGTAVGDGLGVSLKRVKDTPEGTRAIILLTDGVSNSGTMHPLKAAELAAKLKVKVHTIGVGALGTAERYRNNSAGTLALIGAEYDEATLKKIAEMTGGTFFNASSIDGLRTVYKEIDRLEQSEENQSGRQQTFEHSATFLLWALGAFLFRMLLSRTYFLRVE